MALLLNFSANLLKISVTHMNLNETITLFSSLGMSVLFVAVLALLALLLSSYVKIATVLGIVRIGFGFNSLPSAFVSGGLALALSFFVMYPALQNTISKMDQVKKSSSQKPESVVQAEVVSAGVEEWKVFLKKHTASSELEKFSEIAFKLSESKDPLTPEKQAELDNSFQVLAPSFLVSELKLAFSTGLKLFLPFLIIDLLVAHLITALGLARINPLLVSLPLKLILFVLADGWALITSNLVASYVN